VSVSASSPKEAQQPNTAGRGTAFYSAWRKPMPIAMVVMDGDHPWTNGPARYDAVVTTEMFTVDGAHGRVTLTVDDPLALHALGEQLGALMADLWLDGRLEID